MLGTLVGYTEVGVGRSQPSLVDILLLAGDAPELIFPAHCAASGRVISRDNPTPVRIDSRSWRRTCPESSGEGVVGGRRRFQMPV